MIEIYKTMYKIKQLIRNKNLYLIKNLKQYK